LGSRNDGGFAQLCAVPEQNLFALPSGVDLRFGAMIEPMAVALHVVRRSQFQAGQTALVFGAGAIGLLVALWLRKFGAERVVVADLRTESLKLAKELGFKEVLNVEGEEPSGPFDTTFEAAGSARALASAIKHTHDKGTVTVVGRDTADTLLPHLVFEQLMRKELHLMGCWGYNLQGDELVLHDTLASRTFPLERLITKEIDLSMAPTTIEQMILKRFHFCKVMLRIE
jgi:L-iditol 2-dehydrogenase